MLRRVFVADGCHHSYFSHASESLRGNVRATLPVAQIFREQLFAPVRSGKARLDRYLRNGGSLAEYLYCPIDGAPSQVTFVLPQGKAGPATDPSDISKQPNALCIIERVAKVAELADAPDLGSGG